MSQKKKISYLRSVFSLKCPHCRQGDLFLKNGLFVFRKTLVMNENCEHCKQKFEIEPGFWIGALWTSYPVVVAIETPFLFLALFSKHHTWTYFGLMIVAFALFYPLTLRLGRSLWAHIFIPFES